MSTKNNGVRDFKPHLLFILMLIALESDFSKRRSQNHGFQLCVRTRWKVQGSLLNWSRARSRYVSLSANHLGAYGEVRRCIHKVTKKVRAVKIIRKEKLEKSERERLFNEIEVLKKLDHPNILKIFQVF